MRNDGIKTSHDLAEILENAARALRMMPPIKMTEDEALRDSRGIGKKRRGKQAPKKLSDNELIDLAGEISRVDRSSAENRLASQTISDIRQIADTLGIRTPSKATKSEYIRLLLMQLFDAPAGQELIRTFHERNQRNRSPKS